MNTNCVTSGDRPTARRSPELSPHHQLIVIDELGFIPINSTGAQLMFQLCSALCERVALIVTTNLKFAELTPGFGDERLTVPYWMG